MYWHLFEPKWPKDENLAKKVSTWKATTVVTWRKLFTVKDDKMKRKNFHKKIVEKFLGNCGETFIEGTGSLGAVWPDG